MIHIPAMPPEPVQEIVHMQKTAIPAVGAIYRHYKGNLYRVLAISCSADDLTIWVVYECLYENGVSQVWHRKLEEFIRVDEWIPGRGPCARFELVSD